MASSFPFFFLCALLSISAALAQTSFRPKALVLPVTKDSSTLQYLTRINQRTPLVPVSLTVDLGGQFLWVDCDQGYVTSTYRPARCGSAQCHLAGSGSCGTCNSAPRPGCNNNTCGLFPDNTITNTATSGDLGSDVVSVQSTDGKNPGRVVSQSNFLFVCGSTFLLEGLASGVKGMAGLGRTRISLPSQFAAAYSFPRKFAICLSSSTRASGVAFFGNGPYVLLPNVDASTSLIYTPLIINPVSTAAVYSEGEASSDYFIGVKSIKIREKVVPINTNLLSINKTDGYGGTKISTVNPYTVLQTSIYNALVKAFVNELSGVPRVASVAPFGACFSSKNIGSTRVGPAVPQIDLVLQSESVYWRIFGANSMVQVSDDVLCLGFVDGGANPRTSIVIGGYQIEDNLLQFDLATSRLVRGPLAPVSLTLDLGGQFIWVDCEKGYVSSTYRPARCRSAQCNLAGSTACVVSTNTCGLAPDNSIIRTATFGDLGSDIVAFQSTDGKNPGRVVSQPNFLFVCSPTFLLEGLAAGVKGMAGLGRKKISIPSQLSAYFSFPKKFAICLSSSTSASGVVLFGNGPYVFLPNVDASTSLIYTPLFINPVSTASAYSEGDASSEYFIRVKSIKINEKFVPLNANLLSINKTDGYGGTKISTVNPFTVLESSIYNAVVKAFVNELSGIPRVASVAPFGACFSSKNIGSTRVGPAVPQIDLVLQSASVYWRIFGANSMVQVSNDVLCLGFVDGGANPRTSIVIGGHQIEDNLLQFDLATSRLGFSSSLLFRQTTCANFNFTSNA
ncbi:hypothetical protein RJ640_028890 [Escallonia rubra]|uniref:Peptidase A1 domain-containing protein n=1 Tax=Escallonia rubra TaxID=112253 RepID=A0AA88QVW8_9ASTE|nr:hypothetical protein RJ640_028890 [Escallonia rubra]